MDDSECETKSTMEPKSASCIEVALTARASICPEGRLWRSFEAVEFATLEWVDWFNNRRLLEAIGNMPPAEAEGRYYVMLEQSAMVA